MLTTVTTPGQVVQISIEQLAAQSRQPGTMTTTTFLTIYIVLMIGFLAAMALACRLDWL